MAIEDTDLAVYGSRSAAIAVAVEGDGLNKILAVPRDLELGRLTQRGGFWQ